jgi:hypothetical protein
MKEILKSIERSPLVEASPPWKKIGHFSIGGVRAIGYSDCSRYILVETIDGRGLFDCFTGEKILRDSKDYPDKEVSLLCDGIGPIEGETIRMSGLHGGGLPLSTQDGWTIEIVSSWPVSNILLLEPGSWLHGEKYGKPFQFEKIWSGYELRAGGFSKSGETLIIGESSDLVIYSNKDC